MDLLDWTGLAATTSAAALLQAAGGFGFAVLATPLFLLFVDPPRAIQLVINITNALSLVVLPGLRRAIAARLLLRLALGSLAGLPLGLFAFRYADPIVVRPVVGGTILAFAVLLGWRRHGGSGEVPRPFRARPRRPRLRGPVARGRGGGPRPCHRAVATREARQKRGSSLRLLPRTTIGSA